MIETKPENSIGSLKSNDLRSRLQLRNDVFCDAVRDSAINTLPGMRRIKPCKVNYSSSLSLR